jgi:hypothetical protein
MDALKVGLLRRSLSFEAGGRGMLSVETIGRSRREHFIKGKTIKAIAQDLKVFRNTVRKVLRFGCNIVRVRAGRSAAA